MKTRVLWFALYFFSWAFFFEIARLVFLLFHFSETASLSAYEIGYIMGAGFRMDMSMSGYWTLLLGLLLAVEPLLSFAWIRKIHLTISVFLLIISSLLIVADAELFLHWGFRLNTTPLFYWSKEGFLSISWAEYAKLIFIFFLLVVPGVWILFRFTPKAVPPYRIKLLAIPFWLGMTTLLLVPIRGRLGEAPMNTGVVYFHPTNNFANQAGINPVWNFFRFVFTNNQLIYPENVYTLPNKEEAFAELMKQEATPSILTTPKPNIILIILEGFTSKIIEPLGGQKGLATGFNKWAERGVLFTHLYASGDRTDKGLISILSGYPAQPQSSIIKFPEKTASLPYLTKELSALHYSNTFLYGGELGFANMESYLVQAGFTRLIQKKDFDASLPQTRWGVSDEFVFSKLLQISNEAKQPFFHTMLSLSSHEPFYVPMKTVVEGSDEQSMFLNACVYTDRCLDQFLEQASKQAWWHNTWIIITSDHGHRLPNETKKYGEENRFAIPMLWTGGAIASPAKVATMASQVDIANTVLNQVTNRINPSFTFSRNIFGLANPFAVAIFENGYHFLSPSGDSVYDFTKEAYMPSQHEPYGKTEGKLYMQMLFSDYNHR